MKKTIHLFAFWALNTLFALSIHAQTTTTPLPMYKDTGNPQQDNERYAADKKAWAEANPGVYNTTTNGGQGLSKPNTAAPMPAADNTAPLTKVPTHPVAKGYMEKSATEVNKEEPQTNNTSSNAGKVNAIPNNAVPTGVATFPTYINTGNEQADIANYSHAKEAWITTHSDEYAKMSLPEKGTAKHFISKQEFDNMPVEKQQHITRNSDLYYIGENEIIDLPIQKADSGIQLPEKHIVTQDDLNKMSAEKLAYIKAHPDVYIFATEEQSILPQPIEKYKVTQEDLNKMSAEKLEYVKAHPDLYEIQ